VPSLRIVLDPERQGLGLNADPSRTIHLGDDAEIVVSGLPDGMVGGRPSMMFGFTLPDGRVVIAETSWRLFAAAYKAFAGKFGQDDTAGLALEYDPTGAGARVRLDLVDDDAPQFFECVLCGHRVEQPPGVEGAQKLAQWIHRHFREKHPGETIPEVEW
jgi:hypothetical protein